MLCGMVIFSLVMNVRAQEEPVCGNGVVESGEECDDGNNDITDRCDTFGQAPNGRGQCTATFCGDGIVQEINGETNTRHELCDTGGLGYCSNDSTTACSNDGDCAGATCVFPCTTSCGSNLLGWSWSPQIGWLSLSSDNCLHLDASIANDADVDTVCTDYPTTEYGVTVDSTSVHNVAGWAWSENVGWMCFGHTCNQSSICERGGNDCDPATFGVLVPSNNPGQSEVPAGWWATLVSSGSVTSDIAGWAKLLIDGDNGWVSLNCANDDIDTNQRNNGCSNEYSLTYFDDYFDLSENSTQSVLRSSLFGWTWHDDAARPGFGWFEFAANPVNVRSWLQTRLGDIYAREGISSDRPVGEFNATYRILSNGSIQALSQQGVGAWQNPTYGSIDFPTPESAYSNVLGTIDIPGLLCEFGQNDQTCINAYGQTVQRINSVADLFPATRSGEVSLGGKIYYYPGEWNPITQSFDPGTLTVDDSITFYNADSITGNGSGTIAVNGDLLVNGSMQYEQASDPDRFRNLASVAWIVQGDVVIDQSVQDIVGAYVVLGDDTVSSCPALTQSSQGCGRISTGASDTPFKVSGLMIARQFAFQRSGGTAELGSELIIYDGRLLANIPPGLSSFAEALPIWRGSTFSR